MSIRFVMLVVAVVAMVSMVSAVVDPMHSQGPLVAPGVLPMDPSMVFTPAHVSTSAVNGTAVNVSTFTVNDLSFM